MAAIPPTKNTAKIVEEFIRYAQQHLSTVGGLINTVSVFPGVPSPITLPSIVNWTGYSVAPARPSVSAYSELQEISEENLLSDEELEELKLNEAQKYAADLVMLEGGNINEQLEAANKVSELELPPTPEQLAEIEERIQKNIEDSRNQEGEKKLVGAGVYANDGPSTAASTGYNLGSTRSVFGGETFGFGGGGKSIIIGDSQTPSIKDNSKLLEPVGPEGVVWKVGWRLSDLNTAIGNVQINNEIGKVFINIGTNDGYTTSVNIKNFVNLLKQKYPSASLYVIEGSTGWGGVKNIDAKTVAAFYKQFTDNGVIKLKNGIGKTENHPNSKTPGCVAIGKEIDEIIGQGGSSRITNPDYNYKSTVGVPDPVILAMRKYKIGRTPEQRAHFLGQCDTESGKFTIRVESLYYTSAERLMVVWPSRFKSKEFAAKYVKDERKLGNYVYADRLDNGGPETNDGFNYRGRGFIQITGRTNYDKFRKAAGQDTLANPDLVATTYVGESAAWFWARRELDSFGKVMTYKACEEISYRVNGSTRTAKERWEKVQKYWKELQKNPNLWV